MNKKTTQYLREWLASYFCMAHIKKEAEIIREVKTLKEKLISSEKERQRLASIQDDMTRQVSHSQGIANETRKKLQELEELLENTDLLV